MPTPGLANAQITLPFSPLRFNEGSKILLKGVVQMGKLTGSAAWSVTNQSGMTLSLADYALTPFVRSMRNSTFNSSYAFPLVLSGLALRGNFGYVFSLTFSPTNRNYPAVLKSVEVLINGAPRDGLFLSSPPTGTEMTTLFTLQAANWDDADLPLAYEFVFTTPQLFVVQVQSKRSQSVAEVTLPRGHSGSKFALPLGLRVYDIYSAMRATPRTVTVIALSEAEYLSSLSQRLVDAGSSIEALGNALASSAGGLNTANCSRAPNCSALHRYDCSTTKDTCGVCIEGWLGTQGHGNTMCSPYSEMQVAVVAGSTCNGTCGPLYVCSAARTCSPISKSCPNNCSDHGTCHFTHADLGHELLVCSEHDSRCVAECVCEAGFHGQMCEYNNDQIETAVEVMRLVQCKLVDVIRGTIDAANATTVDMESWMSMTANAALDEAKLSRDAAVCSLTGMEDTLRYVQRDDVDGVEISLSLMSSVLHTVSALLNIHSFHDIYSWDISFRETMILRTIAVLDLLCGAAQQQQMQEADPSDKVEIVTDRVRMSLWMVEANQDLLLTVPLSSFEIYNQQQESSISMALPVSYSVCLTAIDTLVYGEWNISTTTNPVQIKTLFASTLPVAAVANGDEVSMTASVGVISLDRNISSQTYTPLSTRRLQASPDLLVRLHHGIESVAVNTSNVTIQCSADHTQDIVYVCPSGYQINVTCDGVDGVWEVTCPGTVNTCGVMAGLQASITPYCSPILAIDSNRNDNTEQLTQTVCACSHQVFSAASSEDGNSDKELKVQFVAIAEFLAADFVATWQTSGRLTSSDVQQSWAVLSTLVTLCIVFIGWFLYCDWADSVDHERLLQSAKVKQRRESDIVGYSGDVDDIDVDAIFPSIFRLKPFHEIFIEETKASHRWLSLIFSYKADFSRSLRLLALMTIVTCTLFFNSLLYNLAYPNTDACKTYTSQEDCVRDKSPYARKESMCYWDSMSDECSLREPKNSATAVVYIAVVSALLSVPLMFALEYSILHVLNVPTRRKGSIQSVGMADNPEQSTPNTRNRFFRVVLQAFSGFGIAQHRVNVESVREKSKADLLDLLQALVQHRTALPQDRQKIFDDSWGVSSGEITAYLACYRANQELGSDLSRSRGRHQRQLRRTDGTVEPSTGLAAAPAAASHAVSPDSLTAAYDRRQGALQRIASDIECVNRTAAHEISHMRRLPIAKKRKRLLVLFQRDLLASSTGDTPSAMTESGALFKDDLDNMTSEKSHVSAWLKTLTWIGLVSLNMALVFYSYLFAVNQTSARQSAWLQSFLVWLALEIFVVSTMCLIVGRIVVPSVLYTEVKKLKKQILDALSKYRIKLQSQQRRHEDTYQDIRKDIASGDSNSPVQGHKCAEENSDEDVAFNACRYLFVSQQVASAFPTLPESGAVRMFHMDMPKRSYKRHTKASSSSTRSKMRITAISNAMSLLLIMAFRAVSNLPHSVTDHMLRVLNWSVFGYVAVLHATLHDMSVVAAVVPMILMLVIVGPWVYYQMRAIDRSKRLYFADLRHTQNVRRSRAAIGEDDNSERPTTLRKGTRGEGSERSNGSACGVSDELRIDIGETPSRADSSTDERRCQEAPESHLFAQPVGEMAAPGDGPSFDGEDVALDMVSCHDDRLPSQHGDMDDDAIPVDQAPDNATENPKKFTYQAIKSMFSMRSFSSSLYDSDMAPTEKYTHRGPLEDKAIDRRNTAESEDSCDFMLRSLESMEASIFDSDSGDDNCDNNTTGMIAERRSPSSDDGLDNQLTDADMGLEGKEKARRHRLMSRLIMSSSFESVYDAEIRRPSLSRATASEMCVMPRSSGMESCVRELQASASTTPTAPKDPPKPALSLTTTQIPVPPLQKEKSSKGENGERKEHSRQVRKSELHHLYSLKEHSDDSDNSRSVHSNFSGGSSSSSSSSSSSGDEEEDED